MVISLIVGFLLGAAGIIFALQNNSIVALTFLGWQFQTSLALLLILALLIGALIVLLISIPAAIRDSFRLHALRKDYQRVTDELNTARQRIAAQQQTIVEEQRVIDERHA